MHQRIIQKTKYIVAVGVGFMIASPLFANTAFAHSPDLVGQTVVVDAGHGGRDTGARGNVVYEKDVTLAVAQKLRQLLQQNGAKVVMTRSIDDDLATDADRINRRRQRADLLGRLRVARSAHPDLFISIHCNASTASAWHGAQALYMRGRDNGKQLAQAMQMSFKENLLPTNRSPAAVSSLFLLKHVHKPATLVEIGFLSNPQEEQHLGTSAYQQQVAFAVYLGTLNYLQQPPVRTGWRDHISSFLR